MLACTDRFLTPSVARRLIEAAGLAPSPDNNQPWAFRIGESVIDVVHSRSRAVPSDVEDLFAGIAMGAAIENIALEASQHNLQADLEYSFAPFARGDEREPVATVHLSPGCRRDPLATWLRIRSTNRRPYRRTPLDSATLEELSLSIRGARCRVSWLSGRSDLRRLARLVTTADRIRFEYRNFHDELHAMLRFGRDEANAAGDGLELASLEIPNVAWPLMRWLRPWERMALLNRFGLSRLFARNSFAQIVRSGAVGLVTVDRPDAVGFVEAGRALQRIWLAATGLDLAAQPVGALPLFLRRLEVLGEESFDARHGTQLRKAKNEFINLYPDARDRVPAILLRVGHCGPPSARSCRYELDKITIPD